MSFKKFIREEYKYTGGERDLFSRPKFKVGDKVKLNMGISTYKVIQVRSCSQWHKDNNSVENVEIYCKIKGNEWVYTLDHQLSYYEKDIRLANVNEQYKFTGREKHLFDEQPIFKEGDKVRLPKNKDFFIENDILYTKGYGYVYDINPNGKNIENRYRLTTNPPPNYSSVICFKIDNKFDKDWNNVLLYEKELEKY